MTLTSAAVQGIYDYYIDPATVVVGSAGDRIQKSGYIVKDEGLAMGGGTQTITLASTASTVANVYCQDLVTIVYGVGIGQSRFIVGYTAGRVATVDRPWNVQPVWMSSVYQVTAFTGLLFAATGTAASATGSTIVLDGAALDEANSYVGCAIYISSGTGMGQTRLITAYTTGRIATIVPDWETNPDTTSAYKILPVGRSIVESVTPGAINAGALSSDAVDEILDEPIEGTITLRQAMKILLAEMAGKATGGGTATITYRNPGDTVDRVTLTVDTLGNRSAVVTDLT